VVGLSDVMALGALSVFTERGLTVPGDVSVCGFDDIEAAREANLTTVQQPIRRRGQLIGRLLIDPTAAPRQVMLPIRLLTRSSSGPARH
jgi:DNA-binding LacI/PurR family transcriptional regulator